MAFESVLPSLQAVKVLGSAERAALRGRWGISRAAKGERSCPLMSRCCERRTAGGPQVRSRRDGAQRPGRRTGPQGLAQPVRPRSRNTKTSDQHLIQINSACAACSDHHPGGAKRRHAKSVPARSTAIRHQPTHGGQRRVPCGTWQRRHPSTSRARSRRSHTGRPACSLDVKVLPQKTTARRGGNYPRPAPRERKERTRCAA